MVGRPGVRGPANKNDVKIIICHGIKNTVGRSQQGGVFSPGILGTIAGFLFLGTVFVFFFFFEGAAGASLYFSKDYSCSLGWSAQQDI